MFCVVFQERDEPRAGSLAPEGSVQTPRPSEPGTRQAFLVDVAKRRIVAWDLLPIVPRAGEDGVLEAPSLRALVMPLVGPAAAILATVFAAVACRRLM
jgi:hypothetical protein